jgi:hypothetical protein
VEHSYHGFFVGPAASSDAADAAIQRSQIRGGLVLDNPHGGAWIVVEQPATAEALAVELGDACWVWDIELRNEAEREAHSVTLVGSQQRAGNLRERTRDEFTDDGQIRSGVMRAVALEYVSEYTRVETDADRDEREVLADQPGAPNLPPRRVADELPPGSAALLIDSLMERGDLEVVNHHAKRTLLRPIDRSLGAPTVAEAATKILAALEDADEVVEIYADEAEVEELIKALITEV